jgi:hypothetical protein
MKLNPFIAAAVLALALALILTLRLRSQHQAFQQVVTRSLATSEGYDQKFIDLVNHLEDVLTTRASFPYPGGRDPMTGRRREVALDVLAAAPVAVRQAPPRMSDTRASAQAKEAAEPPADAVRLTAIIADEYGQHTAIVMDGERSMSVDIGDTVRGRKVIRITSKDLTMEDDATTYMYSLSGTRAQQPK